MFLFGYKLIVKYFRRKKYWKSEQEDELTSIEKIILEKISIGKSYQTIADELEMTKGQVQKNIRDIYQKLQHCKME
ncbi:MAG: LuxR C-terminal-related transcriptional regulator [Ignavibacterium sp.]|nr:LuxR C-terminal-related transcriptional regulator [Ignavibacterium sp.]